MDLDVRALAHGRSVVRREVCRQTPRVDGAAHAAFGDVLTQRVEVH
jgi:hypothetical protein